MSDVEFKWEVNEDRAVGNIRERLTKATVEATDILHDGIVAESPESFKKSIYKNYEEKTLTGRVFTKGQNFIGFFLLGTVRRIQKTTGRDTGRMPENNYWRRVSDKLRPRMLKPFKGILDK